MPDTAAIELALKKSQSLDNFYILQCRSDAVLDKSLKLFNTKWKLTIWGVLSSVFKHQEVTDSCKRTLISLRIRQVKLRLIITQTLKLSAYAFIMLSRSEDCNL